MGTNWLIADQRSSLASDLRRVNVQEVAEAEEGHLAIEMQVSEMVDSEAEEVEDTEIEHQRGFMKASVRAEWMTGVTKVC
jgi:hypothetical protein